MGYIEAVEEPSADLVLFLHHRCRTFLFEGCLSSADACRELGPFALQSLLTLDLLNFYFVGEVNTPNRLDNSSSLPFNRPPLSKVVLKVRALLETHYADREPVPSCESTQQALDELVADLFPALV